MPTYNKRFGVMRGVCSRKVLWKFENLSPVRTFVFPRPHAKPPPVGRKRATAQQTLKQYNK